MKETILKLENHTLIQKIEGKYLVEEGKRLV